MAERMGVAKSGTARVIERVCRGCRSADFGSVGAGVTRSMRSRAPTRMRARVEWSTPFRNDRFGEMAVRTAAGRWRSMTP